MIKQGDIRKDLIHFSPKKGIYNVTLEKGIRCKCGKFWGMDRHKIICTRCKTEVIARSNKLEVK